MIIERIIFNVIAVALFFVIFLKMILKNDTNYIYVLIIQALGIATGFLGLVFRAFLPMIIILITYIISILLPIVIIMLEKKGILLSEIIYLSMAKVCCLKKENEKAKQILMKTIEKYPNSYYAHKQLAKICEEMGNIEIAIDEYIRASDIKVEDYNIRFKVAKLLKASDREEDAAFVLQNLLRQKPDYYEASCLLGDVLYIQENYKEAVNVYLQALNYNPDKYELYYNLGMVYTRLNDFQSAKEYYEKAAQINSLLYNAKYNLGHISLLYNDIEEAEQYFEESTNSDDLIDEAYYYLGYISALKGDKDKAIQYLNMAVQENEELYKKANKELVFKIIINKIHRPNGNVKNITKRKITKKEIETIKHLEQTCEVVSNLNQNDIKAIRSLKKGLQDRERE